jgi:hypothetical protein
MMVLNRYHLLPVSEKWPNKTKLANIRTVLLPTVLRGMVEVHEETLHADLVIKISEAVVSGT